MPPAWRLLLFSSFRGRGIISLHLHFGQGSPPGGRGDVLHSLKGARGGIWPLALSAEVAKRCWLGFIRNSADNLHLLTGLESTPESSLQCAASLIEWMDVFSFKGNFVLNHKLQLKLAKL